MLRNRTGPDTEIVRGDLVDPKSLPSAFEGIDIAYYLVHSLGSPGNFESEEECTAQHFAAAARNAGVRRVMGGVSRSCLRIADGVCVFEAIVSFENNGGLASVHSVICDCYLSEYDGLLLRVRGDGKQYGLRLRSSETRGGYGYEARFKGAGTWADEWLAFDKFRPLFRGREAPEHEPFDPGKVAVLGFIISGRQAGPFRLEIDYIKACKKPNGR